MTLQQKRRAAALQTLERTIRQRDKCLAKLVRLEIKLKAVCRQVRRLERVTATPATATPQPVLQSAAPAPVPPTMVTPGPVAPNVGADGLPDFLRRSNPTADKDAAAAAAIKADQAARKKAKAAGQAETRKAKQRGDTKRMPLTGRDAEKFLRTGQRP